MTTNDDWGPAGTLGIDGPLLDPQTIARLAFEQAPTAICVYDHRGKVQVANDAHLSFVAAFGCDCDAADSPTESWGGSVAVEPPAASEAEPSVVSSSLGLHRRHLRAAYSGAGQEYRFSCQRRNRAGDLVYFNRVLLPLPREAERAQAVVSAIVDISERVRAEAERAALQERLSRADKLQSLGLLAGGVAHDFNNLLQPVLGHVSLLERRVAHDPELLEQVRAIGAASHRAGEVARLLLEYAGRRRPRGGEVCLTSAVREAVQQLHSSWPASVRLETSIEAELPAVRADEVQIQRVVANLLQNAGEATSEREGTVVVCAKEVRRADVILHECLGNSDTSAERFVEIRVVDDGPGMPPEVLARVFDPFYSTKRPGRGVGLSAVLGIVTAHGGVLRADSRPGSGTTMSVFLPVVAHRPVRPVSGTASVIQRGLNGLRVLVVDDLSGVRDIVVKMLQLECELVEAVSSGDEALRRIARNPREFSAVCLDVEMPGTCGVEVQRRLATLAPELPVILMSGHGRPAGVAVETFLEKPFSVEDFARAYRAALVARPHAAVRGQEAPRAGLT